ncbi:NnrU family protein [Aestuariirhabdus sp. Z084]|uniref:NnrU family protein n=1 Tax=Aestuariirhabdus haliotis TaxID=2918751 RepID=UPI00201B4094|nr:NnrU family protein [Aestuariirhabdus haliotis]MCL6416152.1 NnrU family protein [Aestuariirhabdus haliotis]MCL6420091.1 NnrU family protein [Aestuariirhabdus haliotis]
MILLLSGMLLFIAIHLVPTVPSLRASVVLRMGELPYKGVFALISACALVMIVMGKAQAPMVALWNPPGWGRAFTAPLVLIGFILLAAAYVPSNLRRLTPHPMLGGVILWALGHLLANGDQASTILFGGFGLYSVIAIASANKRGAVRSQSKKAWYWDLIVVLAGCGAWTLILMLHKSLFGVPLW